MSKGDHVDKLCLKKRVFYFDIKTSQNRNKLKNYITRLGGTVAEFLDSRVKYLITDRNPKDWPVKDKNLINHEPSQTPETPSNRVSDLLPRGRQLALRASAQPSINCINQQSSKSITDPIEIAYRRGIKILEAQAVLDFCSIQLRQLENPSCDTPKASPRIPRATVRQFKGAFIKLEDVEQRYRPSAKEFKEWPKIYFDADPFMCPFLPPSKVKKYSENNDVNVANTVETGGMTGNENNNNNINNNININNNNQHQPNHTATANTTSSKIPVTPDMRGNFTMNTKTFEGLGIQTPKASTNATNDFREMNRPTPLRKQNALQYCEICGITFKSIQEHINSATHQSHLKQKENFKDLFSVIKSLPKWSDIGQENDETTTPIDDTDCGGFEYPNYPSLTPPSMPSTTITLTPCSTVKAVGGNTNATKGSFLPLHDYINKNNSNNSKNNNFKVEEVKSLTPAFKMRQVNILGNLNNNNNMSNIANNINIKSTSNFKIFNFSYSYSNSNSKNLTDLMNASKQENCKIVNEPRTINNFEQLFSDDDENINEDEIEASCFTPPLIPPLLYPELDIPEEILRQKTNTIRNNNDGYADDDHDDDAYSLEF